MRSKARRWSIGLICLIMALGAMTVQASPLPSTPLQGERWLPFGEAAAPALPILTLLDADANTVALRADLPGSMAADVQADGPAYTLLHGEGYGHSTEVGRPDLPVLRRDVEVPFGAEVTLELVQARYTDHALADLGLHPIYPLQPPVAKVPGAETRPLVVDRSFYTDGGRYPASPVALGTNYVVRGHRIQTVEVSPVAYDPAAGTVRLYSQITFRLNLRGSDVARTRALAERYASPVFEADLAGRVLNYNQGRPAGQFGPDAAIGYLIITADAYYDAMVPFADLRSDRFATTMVRCSTIGGCTSTATIMAYIQNAYDTWPIPPAYVLLVGDTDTVATWSGPTIGTSTDLYYATMDGAGDWHPDIGRGRFPVRTPAQATIMVDKYLAYADLTGEEPWLKKDAFVATCDQYLVAEGTHNYVIDNYTLPKGYTGIFPTNPQPGGDKLYCITYGATKADMTTSFNDGRVMIIYSGHGGYDGWEVGTYGPDDVRGLAANGISAFVASHACLTGDFGEPEVFGETWVLQENKGGLVFWGSATNSFWDEDDELERRMFDSYFTPTLPHPDVTAMTYFGLDGVEKAYPGSAQYYWETYNILGDPAVKIFLEPDQPTFTFDVAPPAHEICGSGTVTSSIIVGSIQDYSETVYLEAGPLPAGITATIDPPAAQAPFSATLTVQVAPGTPAGDYTIAITATDGISTTKNATVALRVATAPPAAPALTAPPDGAADQPLQPTFAWDAAYLADTYRLQADYSPFFAAPLLDVGDLAETAFTATAPLAGGRCIWWQVQGDNTCGTGEWATPFHFATAALTTIFYDDIESGATNWSHQAAQGTDHWVISTAQSHSPTHSWFVPDDQATTDTRLWNAIAVPVGNNSALTFWHRYQFEGTDYDGAVLEVSSNGGGTWADLGPYITAGDYNGTINSCCSNPLGGRQGWTGDLAVWTPVTVDLSAFAGHSVQIRWRLGSDDSYGDTGWYIDDVQITAPLPPNPAPLVSDMTPDGGSSYQQTPVQIHGSGFMPTANARLGETWLLSVTVVTSTTLDAVVPAGMAGGTYTLTLYNGDCQEAILPDAYTVFTTCVTPTISLEASSLVELGQATRFTTTVTSGTPPFSYQWDFGGPGSGSGLDGPTPLYTYAQAGSFTATVTVTNACDSAVASVVVEVLCDAPQAGVDSDSPVELGQATRLTATVAGTAPFNYQWDMGGPGSGSGLDGPTPVYTYTEAGAFTATLTVTNGCGSAVASVVVEVVCDKPQAGVVTDSPVDLGQPTHFTATITSTAPFTIQWNMGGPGSGSGLDGPTPVYTYTRAGTFTATLTVTNRCDSSVVSVPVEVVCDEPQVGIATDSPVDLGQPMHFTSTVTGMGPFTYTWAFGDGGGTSAEANPTYTYTRTGTFTVTLKVGGPCGPTTVTTVVKVNPVGPEYYWIYLPVVVRTGTR